MDQQDLELEQSALEAFNIANDREPESISKQKRQSYYTGNEVADGQQDHLEEQHVNWYIREQTDEQEGFIGEAEDDKILKTDTDE